MTISFKKSPAGTCQYVYDGDKLVGTVKRTEDWTVRGTHVAWEARIKGRYVGRADSRKDAAALLVQNDR